MNPENTSGFADQYDLIMEHLESEITLHPKVDVESGKAYEFYCGPLEVHDIRGRLESGGCQVMSSEAVYVPRMPIKLGAKGKAKIQSMEESLMESPNVVAFHTNVE